MRTWRAEHWGLTLACSVFACSFESAPFVGGAPSTFGSDAFGYADTSAPAQGAAEPVLDGPAPADGPITDPAAMPADAGPAPSMEAGFPDDACSTCSDELPAGEEDAGAQDPSESGQCTVSDDTPCAGTVCDPESLTCTDRPLGSKSTCEPCIADGECVAGHRCVAILDEACGDGEETGCGPRCRMGNDDCDESDGPGPRDDRRP